MSEEDSSNLEVQKQKAKPEIIDDINVIRRLEYELMNPSNPNDENTIADIEAIGYVFNNYNLIKCIDLHNKYKKLVLDLRKYKIYDENKITKEFGEIVENLEFLKSDGKDDTKFLVKKFDRMTGDYIPKSRVSLKKLADSLSIEDHELANPESPHKENVDGGRVERTGEPSIDKSYVTNFVKDLQKVVNLYKLDKKTLLVCKASALKGAFDLRYSDAMKAGIDRTAKAYMKNVKEAVDGLSWDQDLYINHPVITQVGELIQKLEVEEAKFP